MQDTVSAIFPVKCLELGVEVAMGSEWGRNQSGENPLPALSIPLMIYQVNMSVSAWLDYR